MSRIDRDTWFLRFAQLTALRSTCLRGNVGAVIVVENRIISMGYNGSPAGQPHCLDAGCEPLVPQGLTPEYVNEAEWKDNLLEKHGCQRAIHAEANAVAFAARQGGRTEHSTVYCTYSPCRKCAELLVASGIRRYVYARSYRAEELELMRDAAIIVEQMAGAATGV